MDNNHSVNAADSTTAVIAGQTISELNGISTSMSNGSADKSSSQIVQFYFQIAVVVIAVIGAIANGLNLFVLVVVKQDKKKNSMNVLLINQILIDLYSCVTLLITYAVKLANIYLTGTFGYWLCMILTGEMLLWFGLNSSMINLAVITVERYLKVVHSIWHKNHYRPAMTYAGCAFSWASGILMNLFLYLFTTNIVDGECVSLVFWQKKSDNIIFGVWYFMYYFMLPLVLFVYCYSRIMQVIRQQNRIFQTYQNRAAQIAQPSSTDALPAAAATTAGKSENGPKSPRGKVNAIKTMIMVTAFFAISWLPNHLYYLILNVADNNLNILNSGWYGTMFIAFFNICANPFIYAASYDDIRVYIKNKLFPKNTVNTYNTSNNATTRQPVHESATRR